MNRLNTLSTICGLLTLIIISCGPTATFDDPQPIDLKNENSFDKKYLGTYQSSDSATTLFITDQLITQSYSHYIETLLDSLDTIYQLSADTLINSKSKSREIVLRTDGSIIQKYQNLDTLFEFKEGHVLRKYKGHYFLNRQDKNDKKWSVGKLTLEKDILTLSYISGKEDIDLLNEITRTPEDTSKSTINYDINKKQFKKFLNSDGFRNIDTFVRVKD